MFKSNLLHVAVAAAVVGASGGVASASDLVRVIPVTDRILQLHFDDGHIDYGHSGVKENEENIAYHAPLDLAKAADPANYRLSSDQDAAFSGALRPAHVGRKSKGAEFNSNWRTPKYISEHDIYLALPQPMKPGMRYTVQVGDLASNVNDVTITFDAKTLPSETIHVNQVGFAPEAPKVAYLSHWMGDFNFAKHQRGGLNLEDYQGAAFQVLDATSGEKVYEGKVAPRKAKTERDTQQQQFGPELNYTHADVLECDFTAVKKEGQYIVVVERLGSSQPFNISADAYREPLYFALKGLFWQRQGIAKYVEPGVVYPRDHHPDDAHNTWYYDAKAKSDYHDIPNFSYDKQVKGIWGYYHDAGDWDMYSTHARVPMHLLLLNDIAGANLADGDADNRYKLADNDAQWIDEGANGQPDILDEARWLIEFYRRARTQLMEQKLGTGGVPAYVGREACSGGGSWEDSRQWWVSAEQAAPTYNYAALAAWYARSLNRLAGGEHPESAGWIKEAREAYAWADKESAGEAKKPEQQRTTAAVALWLATGDKQFADLSREALAKAQQVSDHSYEVMLYALAPDDTPHLDRELRQRLRELLIRKADESTRDTESNGYRLSVSDYYPFVIGTFNTPRVVSLAVGHHLTGEKKYLDALYHTIHYTLGGNELNMVYLSGLGERFDWAPFHPDSWILLDFDSKVYRNEILPGLVSYFGNMVPLLKGDGDEMWSRSTAYPAAENWPESESRFLNRNSIMGSEFTVHQSNNEAIFAYGYARAMHKSAGRYTPNERPTVELTLASSQAPADGKVVLKAKASDDTARVVYYSDWHVIGESRDKAGGFALSWSPAQGKLASGGEVTVTAVAYDDQGLISRPAQKQSAKFMIQPAERKP